MSVVEDDIVAGGVAVIGLADQLMADSHLSSETNDADVDLVGNESVYGSVDVARVNCGARP